MENFVEAVDFSDQKFERFEILLSISQISILLLFRIMLADVSYIVYFDLKTSVVRIHVT